MTAVSRCIGSFTYSASFNGIRILIRAMRMLFERRKPTRSEIRSISCYNHVASGQTVDRLVSAANIRLQRLASRRCRGDRRFSYRSLQARLKRRVKRWQLQWVTVNKWRIQCPGERWTTSRDRFGVIRVYSTLRGHSDTELYIQLQYALSS